MPQTTTREAHDVSTRKADHLSIAAGSGVRHAHDAGLHAYGLVHRALPERDLDAVDLRTSFLGRWLGAPLIVSAMTGGTERARMVNSRLAEAADAFGLAMGLGSGRALLLDPDLLPTYRTAARPPFLLANLGAVQLRLGLGPADAERLVDVLDADGLILHLNPLQEAIQAGGDTVFGGLTACIAEVVERLAPRPVIVKEVGFGLAPEDVRALIGTGVAAIDVAGAGGTNWARVEGARDAASAAVADAFADWGWPTADAIANAVGIAGPAGLPVVASGGVTDGVEAAICLALGASLVGIARPFLLAALEDRVPLLAETLIRQLRIATWLTGAGSSGALGPAHLRASAPMAAGRRPLPEEA